MDRATALRLIDVQLGLGYVRWGNRHDPHAEAELTHLLEWCSSGSHWKALIGAPPRLPWGLCPPYSTQFTSLPLRPRAKSVAP
jgi:hypothetical protein